MATLIPSLVKLRSEFNLINPHRDKGSDGWIGDPAHAARASDHNPDARGLVHAIDVDKTGPWDGVSFDTLVKRVLATERRKWQDANDKCRLSYVIWNRYIYDKDNDFQPVRYDGDNPHTEHAHFSGRSERSCEQDTRPYGVYIPKEDDMDKAELKAGLTEWWNEQMVGDTTPTPSLTKLRVAPWQQEVARTGKSTHTVLFGDMKTNIDTTLANTEALKAAIVALATSFAEYSTDDELRDAAETARDELFRAEVNSEIQAIPGATLALLANPETPDEEVAKVLTQLLGARKAAVLGLMQD